MTIDKGTPWSAGVEKQFEVFSMYLVIVVDSFSFVSSSISGKVEVSHQEHVSVPATIEVLF